MKKLIMCLTAIPLLFMACQEEGLESQSAENLNQRLTKINVDFNAGRKAVKVDNVKDKHVLNMMSRVNASIAGSGIMLEKVEYLKAEAEGRTVFFNNNGNKQLSSDFVPNDPRNAGGTAVPYWIDDTQQGTSGVDGKPGMSEQATIDAAHSTMSTWDAVTCSGGLEIPFFGFSGFDAGLVQFLTGFGGSDLVITGSIAHSGILPAQWFEAVLGSTNVLGVTFTFTYTENDIDGNRKDDVAIKEIYINDGYNWQDAPDDVIGNGIFDFETVLLHEVGHGLSQGHFGTAFRDSGQGFLHFSPYALMNAGYTIGNRHVTSTDRSGHCSNWSGWPNN